MNCINKKIDFDRSKNKLPVGQNVFHPASIIRLCLFFLFCSFISINIIAQDTLTVIKLSTQKTKKDGKDYYVHVVEKGQTVFSISRAYGSQYQDAIYKTDIDKIAIGDTVWVLAPVPEETSIHDNSYYKYYEVKPSETLYSLSRQFGIKESDIIELNPDVKIQGLKAGQIIKIKQEKADGVLSGKEKIKGNVLNVRSLEEGEIIEDITTQPKEFIIKDLVDQKTIHVALLMPFYLDKAGEISISKLDIEQRRKRSYKSFQFIHFYESMLLGIEKLEELGFSVKLYVYDVPENDPKAVENVFTKPEMQKVDFIIALLYQNAFEAAAKYAKRTNTFIVNPLSIRSAITSGNPYVFKVSPSEKAIANATVSLIENNFDRPNLILIYSGKSTGNPVYEAFKERLENKKTLPYTFFNWLTNSSLSTYLKPDKNNIIISIYEQDDQKNQIYANDLINRLSSIKKNTPTLFADKSFLEYESLYPSFQRVGFYFSDNFHLNNSNPTHKAFLDLFKDTYKTEPNDNYASTGYDIILYFVSGLQTNGKTFWTKPSIPSNVRLLNPFFFKQKNAEDGFENNRIIFYRLDNYDIVPVQPKSK